MPANARQPQTYEGRLLQASIAVLRSFSRFPTPGMCLCQQTLIDDSAFGILCSSGKDHNAGQAEPIFMGLDDSLEYIADDELVEVQHSSYGSLHAFAM